MTYFKPFSTPILSSIRLSSLSIACFGLLSVTAHADEAQGLTWLKNQTQQQATNSNIANGLQALSETSSTLKHLADTHTSFNVTELQNQSHSTESLARFALLAHFQQTDATAKSTIWTQIKASQNQDGGFGHLQGWQSNPLDTAFVLLALTETGYVNNLSVAEQQAWQTSISKALSYLSTQQRTKPEDEKGSYQVVSLDKLYVSSYVLSAISGHIQANPQITANVQKLVTFLKDKQISTGKWSKHPQGLFIDALVAESLHPYTAGNTEIQEAFKKRALAAQQANGSWLDDAYVTAVVLRSMDAQTKEVVNPIKSSMAFSVLDAETNLPLPGAILTSQSTSPSQLSITSNTDGALTVNNAKAGLYKFKLGRSGYTSVTFEINLKQGEQRVFNAIKLSRVPVSSDPNAPLLSQIQGQVTDAVSGAGIAGTQIKVVMVDNNGKPLLNLEPLIVKTGTDGSYQAILPQAGKFKIDVRKEGYNSISGSGTAIAGGVVLFNPTLTNQASFAASVQGRVTDEQNQPLAGVSIVRGNQTLATTDAQGKFMVNGLSSGAQQWKIQKTGYLTFNISMVLDKSKVYDVGTIVLPKQQAATPDKPNPPTEVGTGQFTVSARDIRSKKLINGITITAEKIVSGNIVQTQTFTAPEGGGNIATITLPKGEWKLTLSHLAYTSVSQSFKLVKDAKLNYSPYMRLKPYTLTGKVVDSLTNEVIKGAPVQVVDEKGVLYHRGITDDFGQFLVTNATDKNNMKVSITPKGYLPTVRYVSRDIASVNGSTKVDMGEIRLRPKSAEVVLPDLKVTEIDTSKLATDQQSLKVSGELIAKVVNKGNIDVTQTIKLTAFEDSNFNKKLDKGEQILGTANLTDALAYQKDDEDDTHANVSIAIKGSSQFREAPIAVMVDSDTQLTEKDENNNVRYSSDGAEIKPSIASLEPTLKWKWVGAGVEHPPLVAPLYDTNHDGYINHKDTPNVIAVGYFGDINILNGKTGELKKHKKIDGSKWSSPAVGDIDNDGIPEILTVGTNGRVVCLTPNLDIKWQSEDFKAGFSSDTSVILADIDQNGSTEVIFHRFILNNKGEKIIELDTYGGGIPIINNINETPELEIISSGSVFDYTGKKLFEIPRHYRYYAILKEKKSTYPSIVALGYRTSLAVYDNKGNMKWETNTRNLGGVPVVADFDGDGEPDIGTINDYYYYTYRADGSLLWRSRIDDYGGGTGSSVFDFNNDGKAEVVYADTGRFYVLNGENGEKLFTLNHRSGTKGEYPVIADVDNDGHADVVVPENHRLGGSYPKPGIRVYTGKNNDWANTRNIWNQHSYHVTNINDDLSIPKNEPNSWEVHNTYRANLLIGQNATAASDLTASYIRIKDKSIIGNSSLTARIGNAGGKPVAAGTPVAFYRIPKTTDGSTATPKLIGTTTLSKELLGGNIAESYEDVTLTYTGSLADFGELVVVANDAGAGLDSATGIITGTEDSTKVIQEFSRSNNSARLAIDGGWTALTLNGSVDKTNYTANTNVTITAIPKNLGSFPSSPIIKTQIIDSAGNIVATLPDQPVALTSALIADAGNSKTLTQTWNTGTNRTGNYLARISLWRKPLTSNKLEQVASLDKPFSIVTAGANLGLTNASISTDKASYTSDDLVNITSRIQNKANNQVASKRVITVEVKDPDANIIFTQTYNYDELTPNALRDQAFELTLKNAKAGAYTVTQTVVAPDGSQANQVSSTTFGVQSSAQTGIGIAGTLAANKPQVELGDKITLNWSINNTGNAALTNIPLRIELFKGSGTNLQDQPFTSIAIDPATIAKGGNLANSVVWDAVGANQDTITAVLVASFADANGKTQDKGLALTSFTLVEPPIEAIINQTDAITQPLLVYYSCENGWYSHAQNWSLGKFDYPCFDTRATYLTDYLNRLQVPYKLVKTPWAFRHELQSGKFDNIWLLGAIEQLTPHTYKELREAAFMGDNLLVDSGMHSWLNHKLYHLAGMNYRGRLQLALPKDGGNISLHAPLFTDPVPTNLADVPLATKTRRKGYPFESNWAVLLEPRPTDSAYNQTHITATFKGAHKLDLFLEWIESTKKGHEDNYYNQPLRTYPAITQGKYGNGQPVALSFDLINSLTLASSNGMPTSTNSRPNLSEQRWDAALTQLLKPRAIKPSNYLPLEPVRIPVVINNQGSQQKTATVTIEMPQGSMWLDDKGGTSLADAVELQPTHIQGTHSYQVTLAAKTQHSDLLTLRLPKAAGTHGVRITVTTDNNGNSKTLDQKELRYVVRGVNERIKLLKSTVSGWSVFGKNGLQVLNLKTQLGLIQSHYHNGNLELAVYEAARMGTTFSEMQTTNDRDINALRLEGDELLRALQMQWYQSRNNTAPTP